MEIKGETNGEMERARERESIQIEWERVSVLPVSSPLIDTMFSSHLQQISQLRLLENTCRRKK